ncbi:MAG: restriction endonuclease subunit S [Candidatus Aenigmarchaeota archaeon]|nr:restriction endonuclease subunit S [Candidatus Aenigmarchaeota archaeon]
MAQNKLPEGWKGLKLGEIAEFINGRAFKPTEWERTGKIIIRIQDLTGNIENPNYTTKSFAKKYLVKKGDLLISWSATLDAFIWNKEYGWLNQHIFKVVEKSNIVNRKFLFYLVKTKIAEMKKNTHGSTMKHITKKDFESIKIILPPVSIQEKIVSVLEKAEQAKQWRKEADELTKEFLKAVFMEMFGDPLKNDGKMPMKTFDKISLKITDGEHSTPQRTTSGIYLLSARNIHDHEIRLDDVDFIDNKEYDRISKRIIPQIGDILVSCSGSVGRVTRVKNSFKFQMVRSVALIRPNSEIINPIYLEYSISSMYIQKQILSLINQSSQANLFQGQIKKLVTFMPPIEIQNKFASIVKEVEQLKEQQMKSREHLENLFNALMQKTFKGELVV